MSILLQILSTLSLIASIFLGEYASSRIFGTTKAKWYVVEIVLFVAVLVPLINSILFTIENMFVVLPIYFLCGFLTVISARWAMSLLGGTEEPHVERTKYKKTTELHLRNLVRNLKRYGMKKKNITEVLVNSGFKKEQFERFL